MSDLLIRFEIPFSNYPDINSDSVMIFHKWLPLKEQEFLIFENNDLRLKFWFDVKTTWWASHHDEEEISKWANVMARKIYADITVSNLNKPFLQFISTRDYSKEFDPRSEQLQKEYELLGKRV